MSTHICPNCSNQFTGQFCNRCGQRQTHKITLAYIWHDLAHAFTHTDRGFFHMMGQMFVRPGKVAYEYIVEAKRKRYFPPFQYLVLLGAIATIVVVNSHYIENTVKSMQEITGTSQYSTKQAAFMQKLSSLQSKYYNFVIMLQLPFFALSALILYKRKHKYNYAEFLTLQTFVTGQFTLISMTLMLTVFITRSGLSYLNAIMMLASAFYHIWVYMGFFKERNFNGFLKALGSHILGLIFFTLFSMIIGIIVGIVILLTN
ncbi:MAG: DUF3667 domain-containing protein [Rhizobacter sp.]|nr:DUF3667 domain-containing protein [Ferruginibacter sp.]